jgi:hypothetical protein
MPDVKTSGLKKEMERVSREEKITSCGHEKSQTYQLE